MRRRSSSVRFVLVLIPALAAAGLGCSRATCAQDEVERNGECLAACNSDNNCARDERCNLGACELAPNGSSSGVASGGGSSGGASSGTGSAGSSGATGTTSRASSSLAGSSAAGGSSAGNSSTGATSNGASSNGATSSASIPASGSTSTGATGSSAGSSSAGGGTSGSMDASSAAPASSSNGPGSSSQGTASSTSSAPLSSSVLPPSSSAPSSGSSAPASSSAPPSSSAGPPDADQDTVPDAADNCPLLSNPGQEDEDGDGRGNVCDNCPGRPNAGQDDSDGDTVGEVCDPRPQPGDSIVLFDGFDGTLAPTWVPNSGVWAQAGGLLTQSNTGDQNRAIISTAVDATNVTVEGSVFITNCATQPCRAGYVLRVSSMGNGWGCAVSRDNGNTRLTISQMTAFDLPGVEANGPGPDPTMAPVLLRFTANGTMLRCETPETGQAITFAVPNVTSGAVGLRSRRDAVAFAHVTVIQSP